MPKIVIATGDSDLTDFVRSMLESYYGLLGLTALTADNCARVDELCRIYGDVSFVVMAHDLPPGLHAADEELRALTLAKRYNKRRLKGIILGPIESFEDRRDVDRLENFSTIRSQDMFQEDTNKVPYLVDQIVFMTNASQSARKIERGHVELTIEDNSVGRCQTFAVINGHSARQRDVKFQYNTDILRDLSSFTMGLNTALEADHADTFLNNFRSVGRKTRAMVLKERRVSNAIRDLINQVGGAENIWIRFRITYRSGASIPFEAILRCDGTEDDSDEFQLTLSPVYRLAPEAHAGGELRPALFCGGESAKTPFNCLVIDASTEGKPQSIGDTVFPDLEPIRFGREEAETVEEILRAQCGQRPMGTIEFLHFDEDKVRANPFQALNEKLRERQWDLVHFIGHSHYETDASGAEKSAHIFLPGAHQPVPVPIKVFASWLSKTAFVYLSSCQSAEVGFIHALAERGIPTIVGYRWKVYDYGAKVFASEFYKNLFDTTRPASIEYAFARTQKTLKEPEQPLNVYTQSEIGRQIWAYPMLVMQNAV